MGQLGQADREMFEPLGQIMGGRLPLQRRVHRQHHFIDTALFQPPDQRIDRQILRPHPFQRGQATAQHMEAAGKKARLVERPQIGDILHDAQRTRVAARIGSDAIFDTSFLDDLGSLIASLEAQIDAGSHVYWHGDEHHTRGGYEAVFREPGVTELCHAVADLAMLRNTTVGALCAARGLRDAGTLLDD